MNTYQPGDRVVDADNGRRGEVVEDSITTEYPGFIPVRWDNLDRTLAHPSILKHENGAGCSAKNTADTVATRSLKDEGTVMTIIANPTDKDTTSSANLRPEDCKAIELLVRQLFPNDVDPAFEGGSPWSMAQEIHAARGGAAMDGLVHALRTLQDDINVEAIAKLNAGGKA